MADFTNKAKNFWNKIASAIKSFFWNIRRRIKNFRRRIGKFLDKHNLNLSNKFPGWAKALIYLSPALIVLAIFTFYPIINSFALVVYENYNLANDTITGYTLFGNFISDRKSVV